MRLRLENLMRRLIGHWYDPEAQNAREQRTAAATERAEATRSKLDDNLPRLEALRKSYTNAGKRLSR